MSSVEREHYEMMRSIRCVIPNCGNESSYTSEEIAYFSFPKEPLIRMAWVRMLLLQEGWKPGPDSVICSNHFLPDDLLMHQFKVIALRPGSLPQITAQVCRICFATDIKLYQMAAYKILYEAYETLTGLSLEREGGLPQLACATCARRLLNSARLRTCSLRAHLLLLEALNTRGWVTKESIWSVNGDALSLNTKDDDNYELDLTEAIEIIQRENIYNVNQPPSLCVEVTSDSIKEEKVNEKDFNDCEVVSLKEDKNDIIMTYDLVKEEVNDDDEDIIDCIEAERNHLMDQDNANEESTETKYVNAFEGEDYSPDDSPQIEGVRHKTNRSSSGAPATESLKDLSATKQAEPMHQKPESNGGYLPRNFYSCDICPFQSTKITEFLEHLKVHAEKPNACNDRPHICHICNKSFQHRGELKLHLRSHPSNKQFSCKMCNRGYDSIRTLIKHMSDTHSMTHVCNVCHKGFYDSTILLYHLESHTDNEKLFHCDKCNTYYATKLKLHHHNRIHTAKSYSCRMCKKLFRYKGNLENHLLVVHPSNPGSRKTNKPKKRYICDMCNKRFWMRKSLIIHLNSYCIGKPFSCVICKQEFSDNNILRKHIAAEHF